MSRIEIASDREVKNHIEILVEGEIIVAGVGLAAIGVPGSFRNGEFHMVIDIEVKGFFIPLDIVDVPVFNRSFALTLTEAIGAGFIDMVAIGIAMVQS